MKGSELLEFREKLGLSREEMARELKTTYPTIYRWETDDRAIPPYLDLALQTIERNHKKTKKDKS
jgi:DNA-binding transcriptional regulator YiaG